MNINIPARPVIYAENGTMCIECEYSPFDYPIKMSKPIRAEFHAVRCFMEVWYDHGEHQIYKPTTYQEATHYMSCIFKGQFIICHFIND